MFGSKKVDAPKAKVGRPRKTDTAPKVAIKGADKADEANIALARKANADERAASSDAAAPRNSDEASARENRKSTVAAPEAQPTDHEKRLAADKLFAKADDEGKAEILDNIAKRQAALGY